MAPAWFARMPWSRWMTRSRLRIPHSRGPPFQPGGGARHLEDYGGYYGAEGRFPKTSIFRPISIYVSAFLQQAEDILDVAVAGNRYGADDVAILIDRQGGMRMLNPAGWSLPALSAEYGAAAVYKVERRGGAVRVEGWGADNVASFSGMLNRSRRSSLRCTPYSDSVTFR
jgi:hypothetical protein